MQTLSEFKTNEKQLLPHIPVAVETTRVAPQ